METSWRRNYLRYKSFFLNMLTQYRERSDWRAYIEILLSLATVSVFSVFALRPTILTIAELIRQIEDKKVTVAKMDEKIRTLSAAQTLFDRQRENIDILVNTAVPKNAVSDIFARQIEGLSSQLQMNISTITLGKGTIVGNPPQEVQPGAEGENPPPPAESTVPFSISSNLSLDQYSIAANFLKNLENVRTIAQINSFGLNIKENQLTEQKTLVLSIDGKLPYLPIREGTK